MDNKEKPCLVKPEAKDKPKQECNITGPVNKPWGDFKMVKLPNENPYKGFKPVEKGNEQ
jgi:hypothetical protein